jgi:hypothetical protein
LEPIVKKVEVEPEKISANPIVKKSQPEPVSSTPPRKATPLPQVPTAAPKKVEQRKPVRSRGNIIKEI